MEGETSKGEAVLMSLARDEYDRGPSRQPPAREGIALRAAGANTTRRAKPL